MEANNKNKKIGIIGAGLGGALLTVFLAKRGYKITVHERRPDLRISETSRGRSINLALSTRGIEALKKVDLAESVLSISIPMKGRMIHDLDGNQNFIPYSIKAEEYICSVSRAELNKILLNAATSFPNVEILFENNIVSYNIKYDFLLNEDINKELEEKFRTTSYNVTIGTDGANSAVRDAYFELPRFDYSQTYLAHGYKELTIPPNQEGEFQMEPNALHIWPRGTFMLIALPNLDRSFTCTLFLPHNGEESFETLKEPEDISKFFQKYFPDALGLIPDLLAQFKANPTSNLATVKCYPWVKKGLVALLGDAAHAIVPFYGQGMNCTFEDVLALNQCLDDFKDDWKEAFAKYQELRKPNTDAIADLAIENFIEMRDHTANPVFVLKRQAEMLLEQQFPDEFASKYTMVTFRTIPYAEAQYKGNIQDQILMDMCQNIKSIQEFNSQEALRRIKEALRT